MNFFDKGIVLGLCVLILDFLAWRFLKTEDRRIRLAVRTVLFLALSLVLWSSKMTPFRAALWPDDPMLHLLAQGLVRRLNRTSSVNSQHLSRDEASLIGQEEQDGAHYIFNFA